jgi:predicted AlkP superfamily pyrophosphatase or phosphodiesterase
MKPVLTHKIKTVFLLSMMSLLFVRCRQGQNDENYAKRPKLVVGIVVDQMRWDYLYRYYNRYGEGGFKRLIKEGFNCQNTSVPYLPTFTAPGHSCIYTGSVPALHGIVGNDWIDIRTNRPWYCTEDVMVKSVGGGKAGLMSPRNLLASTITDELRLATNFKSRTYGISIKDRGAILPAGHAANAAFWYDNETGNFITSSYYMQDLPDWLKKFNARNLNDSLMRKDWTTLYPISSYTQSTKDDNLYEEVTKGEIRPVFPHKTSLSVGQDKGLIRSTPYGNTLTLLMAEACIQGEKLGSNGFTDFLAVSFSSTDYVGHQYAPNSIEVEDTYLRFDKELESFLNYLDEKIGDGNYTVFLTADHGGAHNTVFLQDQKIPADAVKAGDMTRDLNWFLKRKYNDSLLVSSVLNYQVFLNEQEIMSQKLNRNDVRADIMQWLRTQTGITNVVDLEHPESNPLPEPVKSMVINGYYSNRCGSIQIIPDPGWYNGGSTGTTHGSWNPYDSHIPLLWYGWGIKHGETFRATEMTDIAATLASLLHIQAPNACVGKVIEEVRK